MQLRMLESLLFVKSTLQTRGQCCTDLKISDGMLKKHNVRMYNFKRTENQIEIEREEEKEAEELFNNVAADLL